MCNKTYCRLFLLLLAIPVLGGCVAAAVTATAAGAAVVVLVLSIVEGVCP